MSSFRDLIARRRPPIPAEPPEIHPHQNPPSDVDPVEPILTDVSQGRPSRLIDDPPAPPEVPHWDIETPMPTMQDEPRESAGLADATAALNGVDSAPSDHRKVWDLDTESAAKPADIIDAPRPAAAETTPIVPMLQEVRPEPDMPAFPGPAPAPAQGGRVKTRLLGFHSEPAVEDAFSKERAPDALQSVKFPVGWVVIVDGPGRGTCFALAPGLSTLGRGSDQTMPIDFGDDCISRDTHASIAYDDEDNKVLIGHGGKSNLVRLNDKPLVSSTELQNGDQFRIGKTTLRFVALCGGGFNWTGVSDHD